MTRIKRNTGKSLEAQVAAAGEWYKTQGLAWLERVEPPQRWVNGKPVIIKPALADFLGCMWTPSKEYRIPVAVECKSIAGRHDSLTLPKIMPRVQQRKRLWDASFVWLVVLAVETDMGHGVRTHAVTISSANFTSSVISFEECAYLPNGAPDILGLRGKP